MDKLLRKFWLFHQRINQLGKSICMFYYPHNHKAQEIQDK